MARRAQPPRSRLPRDSHRRDPNSPRRGRVSTTRRQIRSTTSADVSGSSRRRTQRSSTSTSGGSRGAKNVRRISRTDAVGRQERPRQADRKSNSAKGRRSTDDREAKGRRRGRDRPKTGRGDSVPGRQSERRAPNRGKEGRASSNRVRGGRPRAAGVLERGLIGKDRSNERRGPFVAARRRSDREKSTPERARPDWGSVARRGAFRVTERPEQRTRGPRKPQRGGDEQVRSFVQRPNRNARFRVVGSDTRSRTLLDEHSGRSVLGRPQSRPRGRKTPANVRAEVAHATQSRLRGRTERRLGEAAAAYERDRYQDTLSILRSLPQDAASIGAVRELRGLTFYRLGRWKEALRELRGFAELTGSVDQHPVMADSERALGHHDRVADIWADIRRSGASSDVLVEGRLVMAGSLADRGKFKEAIALLGPASLRKVTKPHERHIRQWYMLGDLYERTGDVPRAREMFQRVVDADPETSDAVERLSALSAPNRRGAPKPHR
jgi:Tetratricopeptide repeat